MKKDNALALVLLALILAAQPFLYDGFGAAISIVPIALFAIIMLYIALRSKPE